MRYSNFRERHNLKHFGGLVVYRVCDHPGCLDDVYQSKNLYCRLHQAYERKKDGQVHCKQDIQPDADSPSQNPVGGKNNASKYAFRL